MVLWPYSLLFYKVKRNVVKVFSKFVEQGKATIKFREPAHDLAISKVSIHATRSAAECAVLICGVPPQQQWFRVYNGCGYN